MWGPDAREGPTVLRMGGEGLASCLWWGRDRGREPPVSKVPRALGPLPSREAD